MEQHKQWLVYLRFVSCTDCQFASKCWIFMWHRSWLPEYLSPILPSQFDSAGLAPPRFLQLSNGIYLVPESIFFLQYLHIRIPQDLDSPHPPGMSKSPEGLAVRLVRTLVKMTETSFQCMLVSFVFIQFVILLSLPFYVFCFYCHTI